MIANRAKYLKKREKHLKLNSNLSQTLVPLSKLEENAHQQGLYVLPEFNFPHAIFMIASTEMNADGLQYSFKKIATFLQLKENADDGFTIIISPQWMFVGSLNRPYHYEKDRDGRELPVYLDGFAYAGIMNLQLIKQQWPATAGLGVEQHNALDALERQAHREQ